MSDEFDAHMCHNTHNIHTYMIYTHDKIITKSVVMDGLLV